METQIALLKQYLEYPDNFQGNQRDKLEDLASNIEENIEKRFGVLPEHMIEMVSYYACVIVYQSLVLLLNKRGYYEVKNINSNKTSNSSTFGAFVNRDTYVFVYCKKFPGPVPSYDLEVQFKKNIDQKSDNFKKLKEKYISFMYQNKIKNPLIYVYSRQKIAPFLKTFNNTLFAYTKLDLTLQNSILSLWSLYHD